MPMRVGFRQHRQQALEEERDRIVKILPQLGVQRAILLNPLELDAVEPDTCLKLALVFDVDWPFVRRMDFFYSHLLPRIGVEFFVYTPHEFDEIDSGDSPLSRAIQRGQVLL